MFSQSSAHGSSQVVPEMSSQDHQEEAFPVTNPSPMGGKGFDFLFSNPTPIFGGKFEIPEFSGTGPAGLMTPNTAAILSMLQPTPQGAVQQSPFVFGSNSQQLHQMHQAMPLAPKVEATPSVPISSTEFDEKPDTTQEMEEESHEEEEEEEHVDEEDAGASDSEASFSPRQQSVGRKGRKRKATQPLSTSARTYEELSDDQIAFMDFKELMRLMVAAGLTRQEIAETKARRRRLKNRQSARLCSNKKRELCNELSSKNSQLHDTIDRMQREIDRLKKENALLKQQAR